MKILGNINDKEDIVNKDSLDKKQETLASGVNIKTINDESILGEGNISINQSINAFFERELGDYPWQQGGLSNTGKYLPNPETSSVYYIRLTSVFIPIVPGSTISLVCTASGTEDYISISEYASDLAGNDEERIKMAINWSQVTKATSIYTVKLTENTRFLRLTMKRGSAGTTNISVSDGISWTILGNYKEIKDLNRLINKLNGNLSSYVLNSDFTKRGLEKTELGTLTYWQSFFKHNGKYYSTNGSKVSIQNSAFTVEQDLSVNLGHGNSFQLGSSGTMAYASGWNDDTIYCFDLSTNSVTSTIDLSSLHLSGTNMWFTAVVDDVTGICYILKRDTYPETNDVYEFIAYDYINQTVVLRKKLPIKFGYGQGMDYYNGRIITIYGAGNSTIPNGGFILSTSGDILGKLKLGDLDNVELEGICITRDRDEILVSDVNKKLYKFN